MAKNDRKGSWFKEAMSLPETGPALRRYFVNTMFDSTFAVLGIIIGSALTADADQGLVIATIITSCVALAISTGSSVYEAETLEQSRRMDEIGRAMLRPVEETNLGKASKASAAIIALANSLAPLMSGAIIVSPFLLLGEETILVAAEVAIVLAIVLLFVTGFIMGKLSERNPWWKGLRMSLVGLAAFFVCYMIGGVV
ncbi:MAG TPA: VIT1/CCC1 transporter family protein, partial [Methanomassiliicoccales archaeon]|nr:VIT1/CCC1 transporter family protein [Methanomassiliicoccales archaeon]